VLVWEYLNQDYPYMGEDLFAEDYPEFVHHCLEKDAELVLRLPEALLSKVDTDLLRLYQEVELPVSTVLVQMHLNGIAVDQAACADFLAASGQRLEDMESQLVLGPVTSSLPGRPIGTCMTPAWIFPRTLGAASA
jgi:hypothetical protein